MHTLSMLSGPRHLALTGAQFDTLERVIERMRGMLHQFAAGIYPDAAPLEAGALQDLVSVVRAHSALHDELAPVVMHPSATGAVELPPREPLAANEPAAVATEEPARVEPADLPLSATPTAAPAEPTIATRSAPVSSGGAENDPSASTAEEEAEEAAASKVRDELDADLLEVFLAEAADLLPSIGTALRGLEGEPNDKELARDLMRRLHTVKGSARMAGAMRLGELVHDMETRMEAAMQLSDVPGIIIEDLQGQYDDAMALYDELQNPGAAATAPPDATEPEAATPTRAPVIELASARGETKPNRAATNRRPHCRPASRQRLPTAATAQQQTSPFIRVRADVLDKLVDQAGEVSIARSKLENEVSTIKGSLTRPDREHPAPARAVARGGDPGRGAGAGARRLAVA